MSRTIQIRGVPDDVHREIRKRAAEAGMSMSAYLLRELEEMAARVPLSEIFKRELWRGSGVSSQDIVEAVRAGRDDRD